MGERFEILNTELHRDLRMRADSGTAHPHFVMIGINEFSTAAAACPILLAKDSGTGEFYAAALFGFEPGELLVEGADEGTAAFQPLDLQRQGFFASDENIAIDPDHPRFGEGAAIALFEDGAPTGALRKVQQALGQLVAGVEATKSFIRELLRLKLVEPVDVSLRFDDGRKLSLEGLYTVSRDRLGDLEDGEVVALFRNGHLQAALCMIFSLSQIALLAGRRNARLTAAR